jgi:hypothetical protein
MKLKTSVERVKIRSTQSREEAKSSRAFCTKDRSKDHIITRRHGLMQRTVWHLKGALDFTVHLSRTTELRYATLHNRREIEPTAPSY